MQLVAKGGAIRLMPVPAVGANIAAAGAAYAIERAAQPALEYLGEKLARGLYSGYEAIFGDTDGMTFDELQAHHRQIEQEYLTRIQGQTNEGLNPPEVSPALNKPVQKAPVSTPEPPINQPKVAMPAEMEKQTQPQFDERNREYQIRRAALGDNPTKEEMDAVVAYGLEQHRINFPHLYD
jgi:hypothetical protein